MENLIIAAGVVIPLFLMMLLGYLIKRCKMVDDHSLGQLNNVVFKVFLPLMIFSNIYTAEIGSTFSVNLVVFAMGSVVICFFACMLFIPYIEKDCKKRGVLIQGIFRSNFVIFGAPITAALYGDRATGTAALLAALVIPLFNALSVVALELHRGGKINYKKIMRGIAINPLIISSAIGLLFLYANITLPNAILSTTLTLSKVATPLALIVLGGSFAFGDVKGYIKQIIIGVTGRLLIVPTIFVTLSIALGFRNVELVVLTAMFVAPTAVSSFTMAVNMGGDGKLAGQLVVFGSAISVLTIFVFVFILKQMALI